MTLPKPGPSLNVLTIDMKRFPKSGLPLFAKAMGGTEGVMLGGDAYLVAGDFMEWHMYLTSIGGEDVASFKLYSLSSAHGGMDGLQPLVRRLSIQHFRNELELHGLAIPPDL